jgi:hypothetical protein
VDHPVADSNAPEVRVVVPAVAQVVLVLSVQAVDSGVLSVLVVLVLPALLAVMVAHVLVAVLMNLAPADLQAPDVRTNPDLPVADMVVQVVVPLGVQVVLAAQDAQVAPLVVSVVQVAADVRADLVALVDPAVLVAQAALAFVRVKVVPILAPVAPAKAVSVPVNLILNPVHLVDHAQVTSVRLVLLVKKMNSAPSVNGVNFAHLANHVKAVSVRASLILNLVHHVKAVSVHANLISNLVHHVNPARVVSASANLILNLARLVNRVMLERAELHPVTDSVLGAKITSAYI